MRYITIKHVLIITAALCGASGCDQVREIPFGNGYVAKNICSGLFVSGIEESVLKKRYVAPAVDPLPLLWKVDIDRENHRVTASDIIFRDLFKQEAYYRPGFGCTLLQDSTTAALDAQLPTAVDPISTPSWRFWPRGSAGVWPLAIPEVDYAAVNSAIDHAFTETPDQTRQTAAVLVAYDDLLIAERYAPGITKDTRLLGWSMSKSFTATLIGLLQDRQMIATHWPAPVPEWQGTAKADITLEDLLHMASGLEYYEESRGPNNDQSYTLHATEQFADFILDRPQVAEPGTRYNYSTAETMLIAKIAQDTLGGTMADTYHFLNNTLFGPLGITDAVLEYDTAGNPAGGAYLMMKPRDWARLGLLYLRHGDWFGQQVLSESWVDYALRPSPANPQYAKQIWVNSSGTLWPSLPRDAFGFLGFQQQNVIVVPSRELVVVRMGFSFEEGVSEVEQLVARILEALPE
ncbi:MAG: serine hydrolase [Ketobacteraceae bacterium]|nr:serine hydrolase [Ketobacteraceae bacterium]